MKAAVVEKPDVLTVRDIPEPPIGDYEALCQVLYCAICTGTDRHIIDGSFPWKPNYPAVLGHEAVGRVIQIGAKVRHLKIGDIVTRVGAKASPGLSVMWGGFAQLAVAGDFKAMMEDGLPRSQWGEASRNQTVPAGVHPAAATMIITWRETLSYVRRMGIGPGSKVAVLGSGGNGLALAAHARNLGASLVAMTGAPDRREAALRCGVLHYLDYRANPDPIEALREVCPDGFDFAIDALGKVGILDQCLGVLRPGGVLGMYGIDDYGKVLLNPLKARGTFTFSSVGYDEAEVHDLVVRHVLDGRLDASIWLDLAHPYPLDRIQDAFSALAARRNIKGLIRIGGE